jgi:hypothetical protein
VIVMSGDKAGLQPVGVDELKVSPPLAGRRTRVLRTVLTEPACGILPLGGRVSAPTVCKR